MEINETVLKNIITLAMKEALTDTQKQIVLMSNHAQECDDEDSYKVVPGLIEAIGIINRYNIELTAVNLVDQIYEMVDYNK